MRHALDLIAFILVIVGGLNWGLIGFFNYDFIEVIFGTLSTVSKVIYSLIGLSALWMIYYAFRE